MEDKHEKIKRFAKDIPVLVEAGFIAIKQVDEDSATKCFYAAMVLDPDLALPVIGLGMVRLLKLELDEAKEMFNLVLQKEPDNEMAKTMLGIANLYSIEEQGLKKGSEQIEEAMSTTDSAELKKLGAYSEDLYKEIKEKMKDLHPLEADKKLPINKRLKS
ncbi:MAG: hypothetical protein S4CHLAM7_04890 [Chlamydiae bacterium]|nr:hypothetical protein [Chlamydiota bacterium]